MYSKPALNGHNVLYKGRRYLAFEVSKEFPYQKDEMTCSLVVYDGVYNMVIAWCKPSKDGYQGEVIYGPHCLGVEGSTIKYLIGDVAKTVKWSLAH